MRDPVIYGIIRVAIVNHIEDLQKVLRALDAEQQLTTLPSKPSKPNPIHEGQL